MGSRSDPSNGLTVIPHSKYVEDNALTRKFLALEEKRDKIIRKCAEEWSKLFRIPESKLWSTAIPQALFDTLNSWGKQYSTAAAKAYLTEQGYRVMPAKVVIDREKHQKIIDGLSVWVVNGTMTKERALELENNITFAMPDGSNDLAEALLWQIGKDEGLDEPSDDKSST